MKPDKKSKITRTTVCRKEYKIYSQNLFDRYWDDGINYYPVTRKGFKNPLKRLMSYEIRMYKTWKHNRKHHWK